MAVTRSARPTFADVFAVPEFRALWAAQVLSLVGDQLARVALAVLVYHRTHSAALTGLVYALGFLPAVIGGPLLGGLADRTPHRELMVRCDLARTGLVALMAVPGVPFLLLCVLLVVVELLTAPFGAARAALLPEILPDERYLVANAVGNITVQATQVVGFAAGGAAAFLLGTSRTLILDAVTFALSALLLRTFLQGRPAAAPPLRTSAVRSAAAGSRLILAHPRLRTLAGLALLCGFSVVPEGLAAPYAHALGGGSGTVGLLMAAQPAGAVAGAFLLARWVRPQRRDRLLGPLAVLSCAPLIGCALSPQLPATLALWVLSGVGTSYQLAANAAFVLVVPPASRGQAFALVSASIVTVQGIGILVAGAGAQLVAPAAVIAAAGVLGAASAAVLAGRYGRTRSVPSAPSAPARIGPGLSRQLPG